MPDKIRELKAIFNSFDLKGSKDHLIAELNRFEVQSQPFETDAECRVAILWMKNIFLQNLGFYPRAEELLDKALSIIKAAPENSYSKWRLKIYLSLGYIHQNQCNFIDAEFFLLKALGLADTRNDFSNFLGEIYSLLADVTIHLNQYAKAKNYVTQEKQVALTAYTQKGPDEKGAAVSYAYSLVNFCRIKRIIGLVDHTLANSIEEALEIFNRHTYVKGLLRAKLEYAQLQLVLNFTERALFAIQEIEPELRERRMHKETISAGLLIARVHKKMLDYGLVEEKLTGLLKLARHQNMTAAQIMSDVYYEMGSICYDTDRETQALELFKSSAKIGMLGGVKRYIFRAFEAARRIDKQEAKIILTSDLVYQDAAFTRNRLATQVSPFKTGNKKTKLFASTLFVDIAGFSALMKKSDEHVTVQMIDELIDRLCIVIFQNQGYIDKFLGDGFMAIFEHGETMNAEVARNAIQASVDMNRAIHNKNRRFRETYGLESEISFRMGLSTGEIYALFLGNFIKREFTYLGNAVNLASKLESMSDKKGLLIDEATYALVADQVIGGMEELDLPGFGVSKAFRFKRFKRAAQLQANNT
ncbi:MAG: hypothetical protein MI802_00085 [Desulfobacterales bacterium]|nr:hypothetical protein [Desulfobacterales bacterium]